MKKIYEYERQIFVFNESENITLSFYNKKRNFNKQEIDQIKKIIDEIDLDDIKNYKEIILAVTNKLYNMNIILLMGNKNIGEKVQIELSEGNITEVIKTKKIKEGKNIKVSISSDDESLNLYNEDLFTNLDDTLDRVINENITYDRKYTLLSRKK